MQHFNGLTPAEAERLEILGEECGEVIVALGKIKRHGYESTNPHETNSPTNRERLTVELGHVMAAVRAMVAKADLDERLIQDSAARKESSINQWTHHQPDSLNSLLRTD